MKQSKKKPTKERCDTPNISIKKYERLKKRFETSKSVVEHLKQKINQQDMEIRNLCAAEISKKEMHKIICDQAQLITELLRDGKEITGDWQLKLISN